MTKAVRIHDYGPAQVLCYEDAPTPQPEARVYAPCAGGRPKGGMQRRSNTSRRTSLAARP